MQENSIQVLRQVKNIVFRGGGVKGLAYGGVLEEIEGYLDLNEIEYIGGSSIGAITAVGFYLGMDSATIATYFKRMEKAVNSTPVDMSKTHRPYEVPGQGIFAGDDLYLLCKEMVYDGFFNLLSDNDKKHYDFQDHKQTSIAFINLKQAIQEKYPNRKLFLTGTNLTKKCLDFFDAENFPYMEVATAMRISASFPGVFKSIYYQENWYIDGGLLENCPVSYVLDRYRLGQASGLTLALSFSKLETTNYVPESGENTAQRDMFAARYGLDRKKYRQTVERKITAAILDDKLFYLTINTGNISSMKFSLTEEHKKFLITSGKTAAHNWNAHLLKQGLIQRFNDLFFNKIDPCDPSRIKTCLLYKQILLFMVELYIPISQSNNNTNEITNYLNSIKKTNLYKLFAYHKNSMTRLLNIQDTTSQIIFETFYNKNIIGTESNNQLSPDQY